jgi:glycosyltransferase involved in cell wall biosynthesis
VKPDVSVLMPVYNGERFLRPAIESILTQTHRNFELVIIDDGSQDASFNIASSYNDDRVQVIRLEQNRGLANALNVGIEAAKAPLIARQDQDDCSEPLRLERQLEFLSHHDAIALVGSQGIVVNDSGTAIGEVRRPTGMASLQWFSIFDNPFIHTSIVVRAAILRRVGGYDAAYDPFAQDYELWGRIMESHQVANLDDRLVRYRVNDTSTMGAFRENDADQRRQFEAIMQQLTVRQAQRVLGDGAVDRSHGPLLAGVVSGLPPVSVAAFLDVFERLLERFHTTHRTNRSDDFNWTLARQFDAVSYRLRPPSRAAVLRIYRHALRYHPEMIRYVSWPRLVTLAVAGKTGRERLRQWWRH